MMPIGASAIGIPDCEIITLIGEGESGVATLYYSSSSLIIPEGVTASIITGIEKNDDGTVRVVEKKLEDGVIPARCAVILRGNPGTYGFEETGKEASAPESNLLLGSDDYAPFCPPDSDKDYLCFTLDSENEENGENSAYSKDWIYVSNEVENKPHKAYLALPVEDYPELAAMLGALDNPHLQHTHGGCEICGQNTGVIVINMSDDYGDGWNGASITVKKDGEELDEPVTFENGTEATVTLVYDLDSRYTFYWNMGQDGGNSDEECSFEIIVNGESEYTGSGDGFSDDIELFFALGDPFVVSFNANDGSGSMDDIETYESVTLPECTFTAPEGMMFKAWLVGEEEYQPEDEIVVTEDTEIKAVWTVFVPQIVIKMKDLYYDGWNGAYITVKKDGEELGTATVEEDFDRNTVTFTYDPTCEYTFYWTEGDYDNECSFEIRVNGKKEFEALQCESESGTESDCQYFEEGKPFFTLEATAIAEAKWGTSADADTFTYGTLADAFAATYTYDEENETYISSEIRYIQLLSDVANDNGYCIRGGEYTLDLNGKTLQTDSYTLDIRGGEVTITDESSDKSGKVITTGIGLIAVYINEGSPKITIEGGQYKSNNHSAVSIEPEFCEVTINGGEFTTTESANQLITNLGTLTINGGTFDAQNAQYAIYVGGNTTISDGTFVGAQTADVTYSGGTLTFEATEATDETPGFNPMGLRVEYNAEASINLPVGYGIYNEYEEPQSELVTNRVYYIGKTGGAGYTVTFSANNDTEATMDDAIVTSPTGKYVLPECEFTAPEGKMFKAWLVGGVEYQPGEVIYVTSDTEVKAVWAVPYIVSFDANGGEGDMDAIGTLFDATLPECTFTAPEGMMFDGWQVGDDEENLYQPGDVITITDDTEVTAVWGDIKIVINMYDSEDDGWHGAYIEVLKDGVSIGSATLVDGDDGRATFDYDSNCTYSFIWHYGPDYFYPSEISFEISIGEEQLFTSEKGDCEEYADGQQIYPVPTLDELAITDGSIEEFYYTKTIVGRLTYTRTLPNLTWNALYVPFEIPVTEEFLSKYDVAYINDVHSYDTDDNGTIDNMEMELIKIKSGTLRANYPYLIRAKSDEDKELTLEFTDATLFTTSVRNSVYCSSAFTEFHIFGTYEQMAKGDIMEICNSYVGESKAGLVVAGDGSWKSMADDAKLNPFRLYMVMVTSGDSPVKVDPAAFSRVRIRIQGEGGETGIEVVETTVDGQQPTVIYDLMGRRVAVPQKGTIYVVNGKKVMWK